MASHITTSAIIKNQWSNLLKNFSSGKIVWRNVFLHAFLPVMIGTMYGYFAHNANGSSDMVLFGILAAIIAVIGTIMLKQIIVDTAKMDEHTEQYTEEEHLLGSYLQTNIHYVLIVAFITIMLIIAQSALVTLSPIMLITTIVSSIIVSLIMHMMLIMLVVLKQFRAIYKVVYIP